MYIIITMLHNINIDITHNIKYSDKTIIFRASLLEVPHHHLQNARKYSRHRRNSLLHPECHLLEES